MRGVFAAGVLDVFLENAFDPFDLAIGVSAGACNLASHLAGQRGRNRRCYFDLMTRREFIDTRRFLSRRSVLDLDWLWDAMAEREPLDVEAIARRSTEFVIVATCRTTGQAAYLTTGPADTSTALKASSALPLFYRGDIQLGGMRLVDGGIADPIPVEEAYRRGARRILVIRTRPAAATKRDGLSTRAMAWYLRSDPALAVAVRHVPARYRQSVDFLSQPPRGCDILQVAPSVPLATKRTTQTRGALEQDYRLGREMAILAMRQWTELGGARSAVPGAQEPPPSSLPPPSVDRR
jgi:predicted patatin/cPLA2 family phospholipase